MFLICWGVAGHHEINGMACEMTYLGLWLEKRAKLLYLYIIFFSIPVCCELSQSLLRSVAGLESCSHMTIQEARKVSLRNTSRIKAVDYLSDNGAPQENT